MHDSTPRPCSPARGAVRYRRRPEKAFAGGPPLRSYYRAPIVVLVLITVVMLVIFLSTSFQHGGPQGAAPTPYHFTVTNVTVTPATTP